MSDICLIRNSRMDMRKINKERIHFTIQRKKMEQQKKKGKNINETKANDWKRMKMYMHEGQKWSGQD